MKDALVVCYYQLGRYKEAFDLSKELLNKLAPATEHARIQNNLVELERCLAEKKG